MSLALTICMGKLLQVVIVSIINRLIYTRSGMSVLSMVVAPTACSVL